MRVINVPIEPYEIRYTAQWRRWWPKAFRELGQSAVFITPTRLRDHIEEGSVLDAIGTNYYKARQMAVLMSLIASGDVQDGDVIFFHDLWFPGLEALQYVRDITGRKFKIVGILHAGTWDKEDFTARAGMGRWASMLEESWLELVDEVYLGSEFHRQLILKNTSADPDKLITTGLPFERDELWESCQPVWDTKRCNRVVFPHRLDREKKPEWFDDLKAELGPMFPGWEFVKTMEVCETKQEFYHLLATSKIAVSMPGQETFGYAMMEAVAAGCRPVVPNAMSFGSMALYHGATYLPASTKESWKAAMIAAVKDAVLRDDPWEPPFDMDYYKTTAVLQRLLDRWQ